MRRALAWTIDCLPLMLWALYATPSLLTLMVIEEERRRGVGIFDPSTGADALPTRLPDLRLVLLGAAIWIAVELAMRARRGQSIGEWMARALPSTRQRGFVVDAFRYGLLLGWIGAAAAARLY